MVSQAMTDQELLDALRAGVRRSSDLIARITDFHGGPITTEYMLTSDIARELIDRHYEVAVEYLNRKFANGMTVRRSGPPPKKFGSKRTDVAVLYGDLLPIAMIEVKIGVKTLKGIEKDLIKITATIDALKSRYASRVWGAVVFQIHIPGSEDRYEDDHFRASIAKTEKRIKAGLAAHAKSHSGYDFGFHSLQSQDEGYRARELEPDGDGFAWGQDGHATRYYAVLIKSRVASPKPPRTVAELKACSQS
jgi:hypothetical protein